MFLSDRIWSAPTVAAKTLEMLEGANVPVVTSAMSPHCVTQLQPVEDLWRLIKKTVFRRDWVAKNDNQLKFRIQQLIQELDPEAWAAAPGGGGRVGPVPRKLFSV